MTLLPVLGHPSETLPAVRIRAVGWLWCKGRAGGKLAARVESARSGVQEPFFDCKPDLGGYDRPIAGYSPGYPSRSSHYVEFIAPNWRQETGTPSARGSPVAGGLYSHHHRE